jgi:asparagine synthetase B (glutamine-hydrolysing)
MCGIVGILLSSDAADPGGLAAIGGIAAALRHRGPDDGDFWIDHRVGQRVTKCFGSGRAKRHEPCQ